MKTTLIFELNSGKKVKVEDGKKIYLSEEEAKELYEKLNEYFGQPLMMSWPVQQEPFRSMHPYPGYGEMYKIIC